MEQEHTPAKIRLNRTVFRFAKAEALKALEEWLTRQGITVPQGERFIWHPEIHRPDSWELTLGVDHRHPLPAGIEE